MPSPTSPSNSSSGSSDAQTARFLEIRHPDGRLTSVPLVRPSSGAVVIGRAQEATIQLESMAVSRRHAELVEESGVWSVRDAGSRNGVRVDGQRITGAKRLSPGDCFEFGGYVFTLLDSRHRNAAPFNAHQTISVGNTNWPGGLLAADPDYDDRVTTLGELESPRVSADHLLALSALSTALLAEGDDARRGELLCAAMVSTPFPGRWAALLQVPTTGEAAGSAHLLASAAPDTGRATINQQYISRSVVRAAASSGEPVLASNVRQQQTTGVQNIELSLSLSVSAIAAIAVPIQQTPKSIDLLYMTLPPEFATGGEWLSLAALAARQSQQANDAWAARRAAESHAAVERELQRARQIQLRLIPQPETLVKVQGDLCRLAVSYEASQHVGGDFVDALRMADGRILLAVADVCGHGIAAAMVASSIHTLVHSGVRAGASVQGLADNLNRYLCQTLPGDAFATMAMIAIDPATSEAQYANAGHPPPLIFSADGTWRTALNTAEAANPPLGIFEAPLELQSFHLQPGETLALYTDGLTEMTGPDGEMLGIEGLGKLVSDLCRESPDNPQTTAQAVSESLSNLREGQTPEDDLTLLLARRLA